MRYIFSKRKIDKNYIPKYMLPILGICSMATSIVFAFSQNTILFMFAAILQGVAFAGLFPLLSSLV